MGVYTRLFAASKMSPTDLLRLRARRRSVLDAVLGQFGAVSARVGTDDRARLTRTRRRSRDRDAPRRGSGGGGRVRRSGRAGVARGPDANDNYPAVGSCRWPGWRWPGVDITRVASLAVVAVGVAGPLHLARRSEGTTICLTCPTTIPDGHQADGDHNWYAAQFAYLIGKLAATTQATGAACSTRRCCSGRTSWARATPQPKNAPYVVAGSAGGALRTGRFLTYRAILPHKQPARVAATGDGVRRRSSASPNGAPARCPTSCDRRLPFFRRGSR